MESYKPTLEPTLEEVYEPTLEEVYEKWQSQPATIELWAEMSEEIHRAMAKKPIPAKTPGENDKERRKSI